ncbi:MULTISPECIES: twin-arginine translocase TatA/TatE family subunit [unclassified Gilliamella]|uniref:twin-arginine translocase TatA/TatE family subunit n=1 Tax=unclassified Gilliamella TaxID=2685620 RepID=UPI0022698B37|nr:MULTISPECIES: twin-arginine translocase TatA/TatE family subunit [unclassified Gilliamella]MCX8574008.1 twin-arginine translocase TatA/TatE family subunit [Gilliamella sp. B3831]MCX8576239.1 twin-arginine translocase TatA/TatE family subunit [Gilliamella sp. B3815]MCX8580067.1 twin-arginine translocase TatA/TatE family subunit [Gilliamella sp. B2717]MCX8588147.1 twin-arginine translocase TatA/TatE family subunit [Gilliamella sp. B3801]MCX8593039.1 twin-arginine translocase TatA/TatE family 
MMPSWPQLLILIAVIVLLFGTKKLRSLGSDLGASIKGFKKAMNEDDDKKTSTEQPNKVETVDSSNDEQTTKKE